MQGRSGHRALVCVGAAAFVVGMSSCTDSGDTPAPERVGTGEQQVVGQVAGAIQIDGLPAGADLYPNLGVPQNTGALLDWVKDSVDNEGTNCLDGDGIATCVEDNITGAPTGTGHWNGVRIVDGISADDQNIFLTGGKENDTSTWNVGPGSIGSAKYDVTQAYLANNSTDLFFAMERSGNNGTTAFDFEFNARAPMSAGCPQSALVPCRSTGDVLFTFELKGSGNTGSAEAFIYTWDGSAYVLPATPPAGVLTSINQAATPAAPWGYVDSHGKWVTGDIPRFSFAEAMVPFGSVSLPGVSACGGSAFVQVRTRSSAVVNSDLKDATRIFRFDFGGLSATASKTSAEVDAQNLAKVTLTGGAALSGVACAGCSLQWQILKNGAWSNIAGATSGTLVYSSFEADTTGTAKSFTLDGDSYVGKQFSVDVRLHASDADAGAGCVADSSAVTVKKIIAADP
jgi:hypothetical protein